MAMTGKLWSISALAEQLNMDRRTVTARLKNVAPDGELNGHRAWFLITAIETCIVNRQTAGKYDLDQERARLAREQAEMAALKRRKLEGELLDAEGVVSAWQEAVSRFRALILGLPSACAEECVIRAADGPKAVREYLNSRVRSALTELSRVRFEEDDEDELAN